MSYEILKLLHRVEYALLRKETHSSGDINLIINYLDRKYSSRTNSFKIDDAFYMKLWHE